MKSSLTLAAIGLAALLLGAFSIVACEGEPPRMAEPPVGAIPTPPTPEESAVAATVPSPATTCCECQCAGGGQQVAVSGGDAAAPVAVHADAGGDGAAVQASAVARNNITGTVTTVPANLAGVTAVYLEDAPQEPGKGMAVRIENRQMAFSPFTQVVTVGGTVTFVNADPFPHNILSPDHERFDLGAVPQLSTSAPRKFNNVGAYTLLCNLHPNMLGYLVVAPSSYYAKTDYKGRFTIKDVPVGTYKITAWAPRLPTVTQAVTVGAAPATVTFELHR